MLNYGGNTREVLMTSSFMVNEFTMINVVIIKNQWNL